MVAISRTEDNRRKLIRLEDRIELILQITGKMSSSVHVWVWPLVSCLLLYIFLC